MHVLIATPSYGGMIRRQCVQSLLRLIEAFRSKGIHTASLFDDATDVVFARNIAASTFVGEERLTHLLFVDSDMEFAPETVLRMVEANQPFIGCIYPGRWINMARAIKEGRTAAGLGFAVRPPLPTRQDAMNGICEVKGIGLGLCLIARSVFNDMISAGGIRRDAKLRPGVRYPVYGFFDHIVEGDEWFEEDVSFCLRWTRLGGRIFALTSETIGHVGEFTFRASYLEQFG